MRWTWLVSSGREVWPTHRYIQLSSLGEPVDDNKCDYPSVILFMLFSHLHQRRLIYPNKGGVSASRPRLYHVMLLGDPKAKYVLLF